MIQGFNPSLAMPNPTRTTTNAHRTAGSMTREPDRDINRKPVTARPMAFPESDVQQTALSSDSRMSQSLPSLLGGLLQVLVMLGNITAPTTVPTRNAVNTVDPTSASPATCPPASSQYAGSTKASPGQSMMQGAQQAIQDLGRQVSQNAPTLLGMGSMMSGASAICPFAGGLMAATGAAMLASQGKTQAA